MELSEPRSSGYAFTLFKAAGADLQSAPLDFGSVIRYNEITPADILSLIPIDVKLGNFTIIYWS